MRETEQLMLPVEIRPTEHVSWYNVIQTQRKRLLLGRKVVTELVKNPDTGMPDVTTINVEEIDSLEDADLRYALRFKAAALSTGWMSDGGGTKGAYDVIVEATDEGRKSRLVSAEYYGVVTAKADMFMRNFHRFMPQPEVPGMTYGLVQGEGDNPDTRFWVQSQ
jgi:hypothetical protein